MPVRRSSVRPARSSTLEVVVDPDAEHLLDFGLVRRAGGQAPVLEQPEAAVDQDRDGAPPRPLRQPGTDRGGERRRHQARTVVRQKDRVALGEASGQLRANARLTASATGQLVSRSMRTTCCFAEWTPPARIRVLTGVRYCFARTTSRRSTPRSKLGQQPPSLRIDAGEPGQHGAPAERGDVVGGVAGAAGDDFGRVVLEDENRRLARHARHLTVDELVGDQVADDQHAPAREPVDQASSRSRRSASPGRGWTERAISIREI